MFDKIESTEDYLERILMLQKEKGTVRAIDIASSMSFSKASVSVALKKLKAEGMVTVNPDNGSIDLTQSGREKADKVLERHLLISNLLESLGVSPETAIKDACRIEHDLSEESFAAIKKAYPGKF